MRIEGGSRRLLAPSGLVAEEIAVVGVLQAVLGDQGSGENAAVDKTLTEVLDTGRELGGALEALSVTVARPEGLSQGSGTGPDLGVDVGGISLLGPHGDLSTDDVLGLFGGQALGEVEGVDALPGLVRIAPRGTRTEVVVRGGVVRRRVGIKGILNGLGKWWGAVDIVAGVVGDPPSVTAVEVQEIGRGDDDVVTLVGELLDVVDTQVPGLHDDILGDGLGGEVGREDDILPHDQTTRGLVLEDGESLVNVVLGKVRVGCTGVLLEPILRVRGVVVAVGVELIETDVEEVVGEDTSQLCVHILDQLVGTLVGNVKLTGVGLDSRVVSPAIVIPPGVGAGNGLLVDLEPSGGGVAGHVELGHDTDTALATILDDGGNVLLGVDLAGRVSILGHLGVLLDLDGPGLVVGDVPVENVHLGVGEGVNLAVERLQVVEVAGGIVEDTTVSVLGTVSNVDGLLDLETALAVADDDLVEGLETVEGTPDGLGLDGTLASSCDIKGVSLINSVLEVGLQVGDMDLNGLEGVLAVVSVLGRGGIGLLLIATLSEDGEWGELGGRALPGDGGPSLGLDQGGSASVGLVEDVVVGSDDLEVVVDLDSSGLGPLDGDRGGKRVDLNGLSDGESQKTDGGSDGDLHVWSS